MQKKRTNANEYTFATGINRGRRNYRRLASSASEDHTPPPGDDEEKHKGKNRSIYRNDKADATVNASNRHLDVIDGIPSEATKGMYAVFNNNNIKNKQIINIHHTIQ